LGTISAAAGGEVEGRRILEFGAIHFHAQIESEDA